MLEYIIPVYEQAKFDEIKEIPVLQVIDKAVPAEIKSYPPRLLFSLIITFIIIMLTASVLFIKERILTSENPKLIFIRKEIFKFRTKK
jgi:hypothetical protein